MVSRPVHSFIVIQILELDIWTSIVCVNIGVHKGNTKLIFVELWTTLMCVVLY